MTTVLTSLVVLALAASLAAGVFVWVRRRRGRQLCRSCEHMRRVALETVGRVDTLVQLVRSLDVNASSSAQWGVIRFQRIAVSDSAGPLRVQTAHPGLRQATEHLYSALSRVEAELRRCRARAMSPTTADARDAAEVAERLVARVGDLDSASQFLGIVARVDECSRARRCTCARTA